MKKQFIDIIYLSCDTKMNISNISQLILVMDRVYIQRFEESFYPHFHCQLCTASNIYGFHDFLKHTIIWKVYSVTKVGVSHLITTYCRCTRYLCSSLIQTVALRRSSYGISVIFYTNYIRHTWFLALFSIIFVLSFQRFISACDY